MVYVNIRKVNQQNSKTFCFVLNSTKRVKSVTENVGCPVLVVYVIVEYNKYNST